MRTTILAAFAAAAAVLTVAACGTAGAVGTSLGGAASIVPSDAVAFVAIDSNLSSGQWKAASGLLDKFPARDDLIATIRQQFESNAKVDWETDVQPALGDELDVVVLPGAKDRYAALTQPHDQAKLDALVKKLGAHSAQIGGWTVVAETQDALNAVKNAKSKLADDNFYRAATAKLATDALVHAYANGIEAQKLLDNPRQTVPFEWASADVVASGDALRAHAYSRDGLMANVPAQRRPAPTSPYTSRLVDEIPAGVLAVADFDVKLGQFQNGQVPLPKQLQKLLGSAPADLAELDQVLGGETAVYLRQGLPIPELTLVTQPTDIQKAQETLESILQRVSRMGNLELFHETIGGQLVVSTSQKGIADFRSAGPKLSGDSTFKDAQKAAGMPSATTGFVYANLAEIVPLVQAFAPLMGVKLPPVLQGDLSALHMLTAFGTRSGDEQSLTVFVQVQ